ncbi:MAG: molybdopterin-dependent oxidoreductase, partial [Clostridiales Family XIII bacterium]|nr:molybdopterin-dependent oxidoreductase [Clostridiales Family XIII bacterium]
LVTVEDGVAVKIRPDPESPMSKGRLCPKGLAGLELLYHPDRLRYPMRRLGERGSGGWERITWDEAYDTIAEKLLAVEREYGIESVAVAQGTGRHHLTYVVRFANAIGTPNWFEPGTAQCFFPRVYTGEITFGFPPVVDYYSDVNPETILVWGANPAVSGADCESQFLFRDAIRKGSKLIVIDPRRNEIAEKAELFLQIRPGTDDALALGMLNIIIGEGLYDRKFVEEWCYGFDELRRRAEEYPVTRVAGITGIPEDLILSAARLFAGSSSGSLEWGCAIEHTPNCLQTVRAIACILAVTGNIDKKGGFIEGMHILPDIDNLAGRLGEEQRAKRMGEGTYKLLAGRHRDQAAAHIPTLFNAIDTGKPYPVKALMLCGNNGLSGFADSRSTYETFQKPDFIASIELFMTPTTALADIVLPAASWLEVDAVYSAPSIADHVILSQQKVVEPIGECKQDEVILMELCKRIGKDYGADTLTELHEGQLSFIRKNYPEFADLNMYKLRELGHVSVPVEYERYKKRGKFMTNTGKVELYCTEMEKYGYDPLPYYEEPPESPVSRPDLLDRFPLILNTGERSPFFFISENRQMPALRKHNPYPVVQLHPNTAAKYGIRDGDWIWIESLRGRITQKAKVTDSMLEGVVNCQIGWWLPERKGDTTYGLFEINANVLTGRNPPFDPAIGTYQLRALLCRIEKNETVSDADYDPGASAGV